MSHEIRIPSVGESISSGTIAQWHMQDGDPVKNGDLLLTLETDKISTEIPAEAEGVLRIQVAEGTEVEIGSVVGAIEAAGTAAPAATVTAPAVAEPEKAAAREAKPGVEAEESRFVAAPTVLQFAKENQIDLSQVEGSGAKGRILKTDVEAYLQARDDKAAPAVTPAPEPAAEPPAQEQPSLQVVPSPPPKTAPAPVDESGRTTRTRMSPLRRKIASHLVNAQQTAAILSTFNECDMSAVMAMRKSLQEAFVSRHGIKLGFMSFFVKAVVDALQAVPQVNGRIDGEDMVQNHFFDIGIAIGTEKGLIVPVLRDCDKKNFAEIEQEIADYANKARAGKIELADLQGGVITISNGGIYGSVLSTPILNFPQSAIVGLHAIQERPVARDGAVVIRPIMNLALSYDHRLIDGKEAVTFLVRVRDCIEYPTRLMVGA